MRPYLKEKEKRKKNIGSQSEGYEGNVLGWGSCWGVLFGKQKEAASNISLLMEMFALLAFLFCFTLVFFSASYEIQVLTQA